LACEYCNEYDDFSKPVPTEVMFQRVDKLAALRTSVVTISGGEPLLHPELDQIIARIRQHGIVAGMITNGYLLVPERIERLNRAGLEWLHRLGSEPRRLGWRYVSTNTRFFLSAAKELAHSRAQAPLRSDAQ